MDDGFIHLIMPPNVVMWIWTAYCYNIWGLQNLGAKVIVPVGIAGIVIAEALINRYWEWCSQMVEKRGEE